MRSAALNTSEVADFFAYLGTLTSNLPDSDIAELLRKKIKTVVSAMR
jgi:hypothetical protein